METRRRQRERENAEAIGGLRGAWRAVKLVPGWLDLGAMIHEIIMQEMNASDGIEEMMGALGTSEAKTPCEELIGRVRARLAQLLS
eukprot:2114956-Amphidinium_carterae.1